LSAHKPLTKNDFAPLVDWWNAVTHADKNDESLNVMGELNCVRSAVMGYHKRKWSYVGKDSTLKCSNGCWPVMDYISDRRLCRSCELKYWFPVFFETKAALCNQCRRDVCECVVEVKE